MKLSFPSDISIQRRMARSLTMKRLELGYSKDDVAEWLEVTTANYDLYEAGLDRLSPESILKLCELFHVTPSYFFLRSDC